MAHPVALPLCWRGSLLSQDPKTPLNSRLELNLDTLKKQQKKKKTMLIRSWWKMAIVKVVDLTMYFEFQKQSEVFSFFVSFHHLFSSCAREMCSGIEKVGRSPRWLWGVRNVWASILRTVYSNVMRVVKCGSGPRIGAVYIEVVPSMDGESLFAPRTLKQPLQSMAY